jgi:hypothetical protein
VFDWGEDLFCNSFDNGMKVVDFISGRQYPLFRFRELAKQLTPEQTPEGGTELLKWGFTRFCSRIMMLRRCDPSFSMLLILSP